MSKKLRVGLIAVVGLFVVLLGAAAAGVSWIFYTTSGLQWLATRSVGFAGEGLELDQVAGTLAGGATVGAIRYKGADIELQIQNAALTLSPWSVLTLSPHVSELAASRVVVTTKPSEEPGKPPDTMAVPIDFSVGRASIGELVINLGEGPLDISNVELTGFSGGESKHKLEQLALRAQGFAISLRGEVDAQPPFAMKAYVAAVRPGELPVNAAASISGQLTEMQVAGAARTQGARADVTATLLPWGEPRLAAISLKTNGLDLRQIAESLPQTQLTADLSLKRDGKLLRGPVLIENAIPGPYDKGRVPLQSLRADLFTDLSTVGFTALRADLGAAGTIVGSGEVEGQTAALTLRTNGLNLRALQSTLRETKLSGRADLELSAEKQSVVAELRESDITLAATAHRVGDQIDVPRFRATARGGTASGEARVNLGGQQPFAAQVALQRFDPAAWGEFPAGSINANVNAEGTISGPTARAQFAIRDSRWLGAPLAGNGQVQLTAERLQRANVEITLGGNRLAANGAFGGRGDLLNVRVDAPRLALVDPKLSGRLQGTAQVSGTFKAPRVQFDLEGSSLAYEGTGSVKAVAARGIVSPDASGQMDVRATLKGIDTPQIQLATANLDLEGTRAAHTALLQAKGDRIDFRVRARGGLRPAGGWSGTVLELANRGELAVELANPVKLSVAPQEVHVEPFEIRAVGGRLTVSALDYTKGRLATAGRLDNLPVARLIALAAKGAPVNGTLRLSGQWNLRSAPQLVGTVSIARDSGDLVVTAGNERFSTGLRTLALNADLGSRGTTFAAKIESALANAQAEGRIGAVGSGPIPYSAASPLEVSGSVQVARLSSLAALVQTTLLVQGEVQATLKGTGTLGKPQIVGRVTGQSLGVAMPAEGVSLTNGQLSAVLTQNEIRLERFVIRGGDGTFTAQGTLARTGYDRASVDWRADKFTALGRPDRKLVVSGQGNAALEKGKVSLTGSLQANEGEFNVGSASALPTLSDDVVVVGKTVRKPEEKKEAQQLKGLALDVKVDLGNQVHITGYGLSVWLGGEMRVFTSAQGDIRASGKVSARDGTFAAYGQKLVIDRGIFYFNGPVTNPAIDIVAMRKRQAVEAGVAVTGTLQNPLIRVVSNPSVPQGEALSWLILGRAPNQAGAGELSALPLATNALVGKAADPLKKAFRLDDVGLRGGNAVGEQFLTIGKKLTDKLYLTFEQSLGAAENLLRLEYLLTERISLRLQAGEPSSAGVFYRRSWD